MTDVVVLGAGLAGLSAARDLAAAGTDVLAQVSRTSAAWAARPVPLGAGVQGTLLAGAGGRYGAVIYHLVDGMTHDEAGELLGVTGAAVRKRIALFRERAKTRLVSAGYEAWITPFGHFCDLNMDLPGDSMARVFKSF